MKQGILSNLEEQPRAKYLRCDSCNSILPAPGFFCIQCQPPQGPDSIIDDELSFSQTILRISLLVLLFTNIVVFKININIENWLIGDQKETQIKVADDDFKIYFKINTDLANVRNHPNLKTSKILETLSMGTQVEILHEMHKGWSKIKYKLGSGEPYRTGWIATKLLSSESEIK
tara:strand:- start:2751 stop:3272 length:522 start_codon:yes stop_codon:yes gene_type:complete